MRTCLMIVLLGLSTAGCASTSMDTAQEAARMPVRVYAVDKEHVWDMVVKTAMSIPTWNVVTTDPHGGVIMIEQQFRDTSAFGGVSRLAIHVTPVDEMHTKVEVQTLASGVPSWQREHMLWRFFGDLDRFLQPSS